MNQDANMMEILPLPLPATRSEQAALVMMRRMAAHGFRDAGATLLALDTFGSGFRRVLVLLRAFMIELARVSNRTISIAPCCAMRMSEDEGLIMETIALAADDPDAGGRSLSLVASNPQIGEPLSVAHVLARAMRGLD